MATSGNTGPLGQPRGILFGILITIVTLGLYAIWWTFKTHEEVKQHSGQGVGGWLGIVIYFVIGVVTPFLLPYEIAKMHEQDGRPSPVSAWTGLWFIPGFLLLFIGPIVWFVKVQGALNRYWESKGATDQI
jgi:cytochrome bd-type quinol oxidase subunit 2